MPVTALLKLQTGPVPDILLHARKTRDLWAGSWLLSHLTRTAAQAILGTAGAELLFPSLENASDPLEACTPNFLIAKVPAESAALIARTAEEAIRAEWKRIASAVRRSRPDLSGPAEEAVQDQPTESFPRVEWIVHPCPDDSFALRLLARGEPPLPEGAPDYKKAGSCLDGLHLAMIEWKFSAKKNSRAFAPGTVPASGKEQEDAVGFVTRQFPKAYLRDELGWHPFAPPSESIAHLTAAIDAVHRQGQIPPGSPAGYALLAADADDLGRWFIGCGGGPGNLHPLRPGYLDALSHRLSSFAARTSGIVSQYVGQAIYCGGDGALALLPAASGFPCADELAKAFSRALPGATASVGVAFAPVQTSLPDMVQAARAALATAKLVPGKDAFCLRILQDNGEPMEFAARWRSGVGKVWRDLEERKHTLSHRFAQRFARRLKCLLSSHARGHDLGWEPEWTDPLREAVLQELTWLLHDQANLPHPDAAALAQSWHALLTRLPPRSYVQFWLAWAFLRRIDDPAEVPGSPDA